MGVRAIGKYSKYKRMIKKNDRGRGRKLSVNKNKTTKNDIMFMIFVIILKNKNYFFEQTQIIIHKLRLFSRIKYKNNFLKRNTNNNSNNTFIKNHFAQMRRLRFGAIILSIVITGASNDNETINEAM